MKKENSQPEGFYFVLQEAEKYLNIFISEAIFMSPLCLYPNQSQCWVYLTILSNTVTVQWYCYCCCWWWWIASVLDGSPPGSSVPGILQVRTLEWVAISFSKAWKCKVKVSLWLSIAAWQITLKFGGLKNVFFSLAISVGQEYEEG